jgi:D-xylose 1-dehydrogenase (NADP+, D-xylono-1,5-lactone-forming)
VASAGRPLGIGILGTARVGGALVQAAGADGGALARVVAVGSRSAERGEEYARRLGIPRAHGSYDELVADQEVEAVYVALPNSLHVPWAVRALEAGRHALCEKPLAATAADAAAAFDAAERARRVLMEGLMYRHHPQTQRVEQLVREGEVGAVSRVRAVFRFTLASADDPKLRADLDGGALMDAGCYGVSAARLLLGEPVAASAEADRGPNGVDLRFRGVMTFAGDAQAEVDVALDRPPAHSLEVAGDEGTLLVADPWHCWRPGIELRRSTSDVERIDVPNAGPHRLQLENFVAAVRREAAPRLDRDDAVSQAEAIEALRAAALGGRPVATG